jgi:hypothetical protein
VNSPCSPSVASDRNRFIHINLLNLGDGSPHCTPPFDVITWELLPWIFAPRYEAFVITGSRIMMIVSHQDLDLPGYITRVWKMSVWDWRTGYLVSVT